MSDPSLDLFSKRLLVISGKGGVGKTVISSALGLIAAGRGKKVLLVKMDDQGRTAQLFGASPMSDEVTPLREGVSGINIEPTTVVADYFHRQLRIRRLVRHIMSSKLFTNWFRVSPAIKEMICLGKVWSLVEESSWWRSSPVWDLVIFDAPATGHGLGLLRLPEQASKLLLGPMRRSALGVQALLENPTLTSLVLVTIPEEMPVNETVHFYQEARTRTRVPLACVILNAAAPLRFPPGDACGPAVAAALADPAVEAALGTLLGEDPGASDVTRAAVLEAVETSRARRALTDRYVEALRSAIDLPLIEAPYLFAESFGLPELEVLASSLARRLGGGDGDAP